MRVLSKNQTRSELHQNRGKGMSPMRRLTSTNDDISNSQFRGALLLLGFVATYNLPRIIRARLEKTPPATPQSEESSENLDDIEESSTPGWGAKTFDNARQYCVFQCLLRFEWSLKVSTGFSTTPPATPQTGIDHRSLTTSTSFPILFEPLRDFRDSRNDSRSPSCTHRLRTTQPNPHCNDLYRCYLSDQLNGSRTLTTTRLKFSASIDKLSKGFTNLEAFEPKRLVANGSFLDLNFFDFWGIEMDGFLLVARMAQDDMPMRFFSTREALDHYLSHSDIQDLESILEDVNATLDWCISDVINFSCVEFIKGSPVSWEKLLGVRN
jgi:hypothetical protein